MHAWIDSSVASQKIFQLGSVGLDPLPKLLNKYPVIFLYIVSNLLNRLTIVVNCRTWMHCLTWCGLFIIFAGLKLANFPTTKIAQNGSEFFDFDWSGQVHSSILIFNYGPVVSGWIRSYESSILQLWHDTVRSDNFVSTNIVCEWHWMQAESGIIYKTWNLHDGK